MATAEQLLVIMEASCAKAGATLTVVHRQNNGTMMVKVEGPRSWETYGLSMYGITPASMGSMHDDAVSKAYKLARRAAKALEKHVPSCAYHKTEAGDCDHSCT